MITALLAKIGIGKLVALILGGTGGVAATLAFPFVKKMVVGKVIGLFSKELDKAFHPDISDPVKAAKFKAMIQGIVEYADICIPDSGMGPEKLAFVKAWLLKIMPEKYADMIVQTVNECVIKMQEEAKAKAGQQPK